MKIVLNKKVVIWTSIIALVVVALVLGLVFGLRSSSSGTRIVGAVVTNGRDCADVGSQILTDGGSAVDGAIAALICEGVMVPQSMGIGGGFVGTVYTKSTGKIDTIIAREAAPAAAHKDMFVGETSVNGALSCAIPGEILGYWELHKKYGRLPWKVLFEPSIKIAKEGTWVSKHMENALRSSEERIRSEPTMSVFLKEDGSLFVEGDILKRPQLAVTLERIAENGADEIYNDGETGRLFVEDVQSMGGILTMQDLKDYRVRWEDGHITANITGGYTLYSTPLPSSGAVLTFILNVMNGLNTSDTNVYWQRLVETFKHAYGHRTNLGDLLMEPDMKQTIEETFGDLISMDFAEHVRTLIYDDKTFDDYVYYGANFTSVEDHGTANMAVLAENGDAVTITTTINSYFGAKVRSPRTEILLNNEMDDFSTPGLINGFGVPASPANYIQPGKIPMSSMCPAIILDQEGNVRMLIGAAGGTKITTSVALAIIKYLIFNESMEQAINDGRMHHQLAPMEVEVEPQLDENVQAYFAKVGHKVVVATETTGFSAVTAIGVRDGRPEPFFDRRRLGSTAILEAKNKMQH